LVIGTEEETGRIFRKARSGMDSGTLTHNPYFPDVIAINNAQDGGEPDMVLLTVGAYVDDLFKLRLVDNPEFQRIAIGTVRLVFGKYGICVRLIDQEQGTGTVLLKGEPVEAVQEIGRAAAVTFQEAFIQEVLLHGLEMDELPAFVDHQDLVHRIVHHAVREEQDHRDGHPAENEYQPGAQRIALPGFGQAGEILEYALYIEYAFGCFHESFII